jgi:hypothetical protein
LSRAPFGKSARFNDYNTMPRFEWREESPREVAQRVLPESVHWFGFTHATGVGPDVCARGALNF